MRSTAQSQRSVAASQRRCGRQYSFRAARKAAFLATFLGFGLVAVQHAHASDFYSQLEHDATGSGIGFTAYPADANHYIDKVRIYASVPVGNSVAITAWGLVAGGGAPMGTVQFPTSTTNDPAYYEISGVGFSYPVCRSSFPGEQYCIEYFTLKTAVDLVP